MDVNGSVIASDLTALARHVGGVETLPAAEQAVTYEGVYEEFPASERLLYSLNADGTGYFVTGIGSCTDTHVVIPATHNGLPVVGIGTNAFFQCEFTRVTIPEGVTRINTNAFDECFNLTRVDLPDSLTSIYDGVFSECRSLVDIELPEDLIYFGDAVFYDCRSLASITIPDGATRIGYHTFYNCESLTSIEIPDRVTSIGKNAFSWCDGLTSIELPEAVTSLGDFAFSNCESLANVKIPGGMTSLGNYAFGWCTSLTSITFEGTVEEWNAITKGDRWNTDTGDYTVTCTDGTVAKTVL